MATIDQSSARATSGDIRFEALRRDQVTDDLVERILALYGRAFARWPHLDPEVPFADHVRWKMESPHSPFAAVAGWLGPRLVFVRMVVLHRLRVCQASRRMLDTPDLAVDPDYQGRGISSRGTIFCDSTIAPLSDLQVDDATNERVFKSRLRQDAKPVVNAIRVLYRLPDPSRLPDELLRGRRLPGAVLVLALRSWNAAVRVRRGFRRRAPLAGAIRTVTRFDRSADAFFERAAVPFDLIHEADHEHLNWRFCDRRGGPFVVRALEEKGELIGYAVHRPARPTGFLADLLVLPDRDDAVVALARDAVDHLAAGGASAISCWLPHRHPYRAALRRAGFLTLPKPVPLRYRGERTPVHELAFLDRADSRLHFTMASTDLV